MKLERLNNPSGDPLVDVMNQVLAVLEGFDERIARVEQLQQSAIVSEVLEGGEAPATPEEAYWDWYRARRERRRDS